MSTIRSVLKISFVKLSTRPEQRVGSDEIWDKSESDLKIALESMNIPYEIQEGEGAFYGPKIEFHCMIVSDKCMAVLVRFSLISTYQAV